jgi:3-oxoacyl-[acyl-carrier protein] reductase
MDHQVQRVALVTGGALGLGRAIALRLAADGAAVAVAYHSHPAEDTVAEIAAHGGTAVGVQLDVTDPDAVNAAVGTVVERLGGLDILVNNAGGLLARIAIEEMPDEHWNRIMAVNLASAFYCTRAAIPHLGPDGRIVNLSSLAAENGGGPGASAYAAAKAGLIGFTRAAAKELGPRGITVNAIAPGFIDDTPFHATFSPPDAQRAMVAQAAVGRAGVPADIAALVSYLASPEAGFVTGTVTDINGGSYFR